MRQLGSEDGMTLVELLVAMTLGVVVMGGVVILLIGAMRSQPKLDSQATNIQTARWALERMTREIRGGIVVERATASSVSFQAYVRHATCGGTTLLASTEQPKKCEITYTCAGTSCTRAEANPGEAGVAKPVFSGINDASEVFCYVPSTAKDPTECGTAKSPTSSTYVGVTLRLPDESGSGALTASDGASLRNATLSN